MPAIHHARIVTARVRPTIDPPSGHGAIHFGMRFHGGPRATHTFCGAPIADMRIIHSPFRGAFDPAIVCPQCGDAVDRAADRHPTGGTSC